MKSDAVINNKEVTLTAEETEAGAKFHLKRYAFVIINGQVVYNDNQNDDRDHQHWLLEDYGISIEQFEKLPRGYMMEDRIQFFVGSSFKPIEDTKLIDSVITSLVDRHINKYGRTKVGIYNGVRVGNIGEIWKPIHVINIIDT